MRFKYPKFDIAFRIEHSYLNIHKISVFPEKVLLILVWFPIPGQEGILEVTLYAPSVVVLEEITQLSQSPNTCPGPECAAYNDYLKGRI